MNNQILSEPTIEIPITKSELILLQLALQEYKYQIDKNRNHAPVLGTMVLRDLKRLEDKLLSNEKSIDCI